MRGTPSSIFAHTHVTKRVFTQGVLLGVRRISCTLLCFSHLIICFIGAFGYNYNYGLIAIKGRIY